MTERTNSLEIALRFGEVSKKAVRKCTEWFDKIDSKGNIYYSNEHLFTSFIVKYFNEYINEIRKDYYLTIETNRELVELASGCHLSDRDNSIESYRHRFDIVLWDRNTPIGIFEVKANEQFEGIKNDVEKLWYALRRTEGFGLKFAILISYMPLSEKVEFQWNARVKRLKEEETYKFTSDFSSWSRGSDARKNGCGVIILTHDDIGPNWKLKD